MKLTQQRLKYLAGGAFLVLCFSISIVAQGKGAAGTAASGSAATAGKLPTVTQINIAGLKKALTANGRPLLVNFWATWCDPCRDEFPDLVKLDADYKGKIDFITISMDDLAEINRDVPKFLADMKAPMPAFLLKAEDDDAAINAVSKNFSGALPFTILFDASGKEAYFRQGKVVLETLRSELDKLLVTKKTAEPVAVMDFVKIKNGRRDEALFYYENNWKIYREAAIKQGVIKSFELVESVPDPASQFDLILVTRYADDDQYKNSEKNFEPILKQLRPGGPVLKNEVKPEDFRQSVFLRVVRTRFSGTD